MGGGGGGYHYTFALLKMQTTVKHARYVIEYIVLEFQRRSFQ
jgi:hypothetical protein